MSDENGLFTISGVPGGVSVNVTATKTGYLTATRTVTLNADTHVDIEVVRSPVYRLSGAVYEETPAGRIPIEGVHVEDSRVHNWSETDRNGFYTIPDLDAGVAELYIAKEGYETRSRVQVPTQGDTRFDIQLIRR